MDVPAKAPSPAPMAAPPGPATAPITPPIAPPMTSPAVMPPTAPPTAIGSTLLGKLAAVFGVASDGPLFATAPGTASFSDSVGSTGPPLGHLMSTPQPPGAFHYSRKCGTRNGEGETADAGWQMEVDTSRFDGIAAYRCLCVRTGSGIMEACPHRRALPPPRTTWATLASRVYSVLQSKRPLRAPSAL